MIEHEMMVSRTLVGRDAPAFTMEASGGQTVSLQQYHGKWLVLFFYPRDFTFVCPTEISGLDARLEEFTVLRAEILGVSTDSTFTHDAWMRAPIEEGGLRPVRFPLGADVTHTVTKAYGVYDEAQGMALRGLFIIDPDGIVQYEVVHNASVGRNIDEVLRVLQAIQAGGLCPVNWQPGEPMLNPK